MQGIPTGDIGPTVNASMLFIVAVMLVLLVATLGYRKRARALKYWIIAAIEVSVFVFSWWFLSEMASLAIITYTGYPLEISLIIINILIALIFLGLCILLTVIERYRGTSNMESSVHVFSEE